jgi:hypothetical protein
MDTPKELTITCAYGVEPHLLELDQHSTYRGLLDGGPTHELNQQLLEGITSYQGRIPTHLVRPTERLVDRKRPSPFGPLMFLPERQCTGLFDVGGRWLTIVWFQETWAPPIDPVVLEKLQTLDFLTIAFDEVGTW